MRVGVIRGDVPSPIFLADLEPTSQFNPPTEPFGQTRYVSRPDPLLLTYLMAGVYQSDETLPGNVGDIVDGTEVVPPSLTLPIPKGSPGYGGVPAGVQSTVAVTFPVTLTGANDVIRVKNTLAGSFVAVTIANATYNTMAALLTAVNSALTLANAGATATQDSTGTLLVIQSTVPGVGSYIAVDTVGNGSTFNTPANLGAGGQTFTMPSATTIITALNPVVTPPATGSINVSAANLLSTAGASPNTSYLADFIAPSFKETATAVQSYQVGGFAKYLELTWNPDPRRLPAITAGPAIQVVEDDGVTNFSSSALAPLPRITAATHNVPAAGDITITGVGLGNVEYLNATIVTVRQAASAATPGTQPASIRVTQSLLNKTVSSGTQGSVSNTSIVIPASLLNALNGAGGTVALGVAGSTVEVKYETFSNSNYGTAATIASTALQSYVGADGSLKEHVVVTVTGLSNIQASQVGQPINISGAASFANNGEFIIQSVVSSSSVTYFNDVAVAPDANNGAISWSTPGPVLFPVA
jgi:hypothetical protein